MNTPSRTRVPDRFFGTNPRGPLFSIAESLFSLLGVHTWPKKYVRTNIVFQWRRPPRHRINHASPNDERTTTNEQRGFTERTSNNAKPVIPSDLGPKLQLSLGTLSFAICFAAWGLISAFAPRFRQLLHLSATETAILVAVPVLLGSL